MSLRRPTPWWWDSSHGSPGSASSAAPGPQRRWSSCGPSSGSTMHSTTRRSPTSRPHSGGKKDDVCNLSTVAAKLSLSPPSAILVRLCSTFVVGLAGEDVESVCLVCWLPWHFGGSLFFYNVGKGLNFAIKIVIFLKMLYEVAQWMLRAEYIRLVPAGTKLAKN